MNTIHLVRQVGIVTREDRERRSGYKGGVVWFTGLPCSGKSTLAFGLDAELFRRGVGATVLDGDNVRHGLNRDLGFSPEDRRENIRRIGEVAKLFCDAGWIAVTAFISPYREDRNCARSLVEAGRFVEILCDCPLEVCESRDRKGMYKRARSGEIKEFTGVSAPYEAPERADLVVDTNMLSVDDGIAKVVGFLESEGWIPRD
jgi:adenylylsulfate kinase